MNASIARLAIASIIGITVISSIPFIGFTVDSIDEKQGVMLDFAYYDTEWHEMDFEEGLTGMEALQSVCIRNGYPIEFNADGTVYSVNGATELLNVSWGLYVLSAGPHGTRWVQVDDPFTYDVSDEMIISWARTGTGSEMMPAVDQTGFTYYSYAKEGRGIGGDELKVVTLAPSVTETVVAVGGLDYIIGTDRYSDYPIKLVDRQRSGDISIVGGYTDPNFEMIVAEKPDIVFLDGGTGEHVTMADKFRKAGVNCVVLYNAVDMNDLFRNLWICASAIGFPENGNGYISDVRESVNSICRVANLQDRKVFVSLGISSTSYTAGSDTYVTSILESLGATNIFAEDSASWFTVNEENVYDRQPDIIVVIHEGGEISSQRDYRILLSRFSDLWKQTPAYRNGNVYVFSGNAASLLSRAGARLPESLELLAKIMDPEDFLRADPTDRVNVKYYDGSYNDGDNGYLTYVKAQGLLKWQK